MQSEYKNKNRYTAMYLTTEIKNEIFKKHGKSEADTGNTEGQIALFTHRIDHLTGHLKTNQKFQKLCRLEQLGIYVDEAHHAFGTQLAKDMGMDEKKKDSDTSLRRTIDELANSLERAGTQVVACYNFTGTPYVGQYVLPEVVYAYSLKDAIDNNYLKKVKLHGYSNPKSKWATAN